MSRRSAISGPGGGGGLSLASRSRMRVSSSITLPPRLSMSSACALAPPNAIDAARPPARMIRRMLLLRRRRRLRHCVLVGDERFAEIDRRPILGIGGDGVALLESDHLHLQLLALGRSEGAARLGGETVA